MGKAYIRYDSLGRRELWKDEDLLMSDTHLEERGDYEELIEKCQGDVLMLGLGLGTVNPKLDYTRINSVEIVELHPDVIEVVAERFPKTKVLQGDARTYQTEKKYDVIWIDIWDDITIKKLPEMNEMIDHWKGHLKPMGWIDCFYRKQLQEEADFQKGE
ncbi:MAG: hypothetical protein R8G66_17095 [Cytophagales bacterium]|nr:hypothetical protein [Cytophagales bacterium]